VSLAFLAVTVGNIVEPIGVVGYCAKVEFWRLHATVTLLVKVRFPLTSPTQTGFQL
jgi:hypothetical protein